MFHYFKTPYIICMFFAKFYLFTRPPPAMYLSLIKSLNIFPSVGEDVSHKSFYPTTKVIVSSAIIVSKTTLT